MTIVAVVKFKAWCDNGRCGECTADYNTVQEAHEAAVRLGWVMSLPFGMSCPECWEARREEVEP